MKKAIIFTALAAVMLYFGCKHTEPAEPIVDYHAELAGFLSTRAAAPLEGTVWMAVSTDEFHRMLLFKDGSVHLFYGLIENGEMQRWSEYYSAPYELSESATMAFTELVYPIFGERECTETLTVVQSEDMFTIVTDLDVYEYVGEYSSDLDDRWVLFTITIRPWGDE